MSGRRRPPLREPGQPRTDGPAPPPAAPSPVAAAAGATGTIDRLKELKGLLDAGVLTQTEFDAQKHKLLDD